MYGCVLSVLYGRVPAGTQQKERNDQTCVFTTLSRPVQFQPTQPFQQMPLTDRGDDATHVRPFV
jgi:hypothetical protein